MPSPEDVRKAIAKWVATGRMTNACLDAIKAQAGDSTEYVLAQVNRELRAELTTARNALFNESLRCESRIKELEKAIKDALYQGSVMLEAREILLNALEKRGITQ